MQLSKTLPAESSHWLIYKNTQRNYYIPIPEMHPVIKIFRIGQKSKGINISIPILVFKPLVL